MSRHSHQSSFATEAKALLATAAAAEKEWADQSESNMEACATLPTPAYGEFDYECCNSWAGQDAFRGEPARCPRCKMSGTTNSESIKAGYQPHRDYEYGCRFTVCKTCGFMGWEHWDDR